MQEFTWLASKIAGNDTAAVVAAAAAVERYTERLMALVRLKLPKGLECDVEPENFARSVYGQLHRRLLDRDFFFEDSHDIWRLLSALTCHRVASKHMLREQARQDEPRVGDATPESLVAALDQRVPEQEDLEIFFESLVVLIGSLPDEFREIVKLRLEGSSIEDIVEVVGCSSQIALSVLDEVRERALQNI